MKDVVVRLACLGLSAQIGMSLPLWLPYGDGGPPKTPLYLLPHLPDGWLMLLVFSASVALFIVPHRRWSAWLMMAAMVLQANADINRLQPWFYFYFLVFAASLSQKTPEAALRWVVAAVYFWSGFYKLTPWYAEQNFVWFCEAFLFTAWAGKHIFLGYASAFLEMMLGVGLLWRPSRPYFRIFTLFFHSYIILVLSPLGADWNHVVIPWNLAMAAMVWVLFAPREAPDSLRVTGVAWIPVVLAAVAPALQTVHAWPTALSWTMYSNTQTEVVFYNNGGMNDKMKDIWEKHAFDNGTKLLLDDWSMAVRNTPLVNHTRNYFKLGAYLCDCRATSVDSTGIYFLKVDRWENGSDSLTFFPCSRLHKSIFLF
ncbi:MAG: hypothetical protein IT270_18550 [Saprospiraceae bacterium]|nr:hypothetical protein [Saprospiraceae bacterium]